MEPEPNQNFKETLSLSQKEIEQFHREGYLGPFPLIEKGEIETVIKSVYSSFPNLLLPNILARHAVVKEMAVLAVQPGIIKKLESLLGKDILLWGSQFIKQKGMKVHRFHRDAEYSTIEGVCVWLGLKNVIKGDTFKVITGSHLFNTTPQELKGSEGLSIMDELSVEKAARKINPESRLRKLAVVDGEFIIFNGKLWHATQNITNKSRIALNFRYSTPENKILISKNGELTPNSWEKIRPLCLVAAGEDNIGINRLFHLEKINQTKSFVKGIIWYLPNNIRRRALNTFQRLMSNYKQ